MSNGSPDKLKPALIGGVAAGLASSIPPIYCLNCLCCALYIGGGFLAAYLYLKEAPPTAEAALGEGAIVGALAGVVAAVVAGAVSIVIALAFGFDAAWLMEMMEGFGAQIPPEMREAMEQSGGATIGSQLLGALIGGVFAVIFSTLGGVLGAAVLHKKAAPPAPPTAPPAPPTFEG